jgi:MFS transporter, DHA1 family, multidrug resistance protein
MSRAKDWIGLSRGSFSDAGQRNVLLVSLSQGLVAFSLHFVSIFVPFYVFKISPYGTKETLMWIGIILGTSGICTALTSPIWGSLSHRFSAKALYLRSMAAHSIIFFCIAFTTNIHLIFLLKALQGIFGGASTIGLILVSSSSTKEKIPANLGMFQSWLTMGQLLGPPLGTFAAAIVGYKAAFLSGSALLFVTFLFCVLFVTDVSPARAEEKAQSVAPSRWSLDSRILIGWFVCFIIQIQLMFLPSVLPTLLGTFGVHGAPALKMAGIVVMCYTAASVFSTYTWGRLVGRFGLFKLLTFLLLMGVLFQSLLAFATGVLNFTVIRMIQTGFIAAIIPLIIAIFAREQRGGIIGLMNASRFTGNAVGPFLATWLFAFADFQTLCLLIGLFTAFALAGFRAVFRTDPSMARMTKGPGP